MAASGRTMNDVGGGPDGESTAATLSPKNEPHATIEKVLLNPTFMLKSDLNLYFVISGCEG